MRRLPARRRAGRQLAVAAALTLLAAAACTPPHPAPPPPYTLRVLAGDELDGLQPVLAKAAAATGVTVRLTLTDDATVVDDVNNGTAQRDYDAVWVASGDYLELYGNAASTLVASTPIMSSPVVLAVRSSVAARLGWNRQPVTWRDIARAAAAGTFTFGMASPVTSDSGLSALVGVATAVAGRGAALTDAEARQATPDLAGLFRGQQMTAETPGELAKAYRNDLAAGKPAPDGVIGYESDLLALKAQAPRSDPLTLIYPADGAVSATFPLALESSAPRAATVAFATLVGYLTSASVQRQIVTSTGHRPVNDSVPLIASLPGGLRAFRFPDDLTTLGDLVSLYNGKLRPPGHTIFVLDVSASMQGAPLRQLEQALSALTSAGSTRLEQFSEFRSGEEVTFLPFNYATLPATVFHVLPGDPAPALAAIRRYITTLRAHGRTAIYDALVRAYQLMQAQDEGTSGRIDSIVLLTDGQNDWGSRRSVGDFLAYYRSLPPGTPAPPVYVIAIGQADVPDLTQVANLTNGDLVDATHQPLSDLNKIIQEIRGAQ